MSRLRKSNSGFVRHDANVIGLKQKWRKPRGIQNKLRLQMKGHPSLVRIGHGTKKVSRNQHKGLEIVQVHNQKDLESLNPEKHAAVISSSLGTKKKEVILKKSKELKITLVNIRKVDEYLKNIEENRKKKTSKKQESIKKKQEVEKTKKEAKKETKDEESKKKEQEAQKKKILEKGMK